MPEPTVRSRTVPVVSTSPGPPSRSTRDGDVDGQATDVVPSELHLAGVDTGAQLEVEGRRGPDHVRGATEGLGRRREAQDPVSGGLDQDAVMSPEQAFNGHVELVEHAAPSPVAVVRPPVPSSPRCP